MKKIGLHLILGMLTASNGALAAPSVSALAWLTGTWQGESSGQWIEETFTAPRGGMVLETNRFVAGEQTTFFEFARMMEQNGTLVLMPMPNGQTGVSFPLKELSESSVTFENPNHDFPRTITYKLDAAGSLVTLVEGKQDGKAVSWVFHYQKAKGN